MKRSVLIALAAILLAVFVLAFAQTPAASPVPPVDQKKACLSCHDQIAEVFNLPVVHRPLTDGKCSACHNPHAARHAGLLEDNQADLCARCHAQAAAWKAQFNVHDPVAKGRCTACHDPHGSKNAHLLKSTPRELCSNCHAEVKDWATRPVQHDPVKKGQCNVCHDPHAGKGDHLLKQEQAKLCLSCHEVSPLFTSVHRGFDPQNVRCSACHDPHAGDTQTLVMQRVHPPFKERDCQACHIPQAAGKIGYPLKGSALAVCGECHSDEAAQVRQFSAHGSNDQHSCEQCHNGHASHDAGLLLLPQRQLCRKCHPEPAAGTSTPDPHAKQACTTCHAQHGSDVKPYLREPPLTLCAKCHSREHHIAHPMGEAALDPNTKQPVTCISCHSLHGWKADPLLPAEGSRDLCVRCHNK